MQGFLNIDKPPEWTSRDVVNVVTKLFPRGTKVGHAGTLDPLATGVLVVAVGRATRLISYAQDGAKTYVGEFLLGRTSDTEDIEGEVRELASPPIPTREELDALLPAFIGPIMQRPPAYSAIQVGGQRSYARARRGEQVELPSRPVQIHSLKLLDFAYPRFELEVICGKGTYIRSLGRDIAEKLHSGAVMSKLQRRRVGAFGIETSLHLQQLRDKAVSPTLLPSLLAIPNEIPRVELPPAALRALLMGQAIISTEDAAEIAVIHRGGELASLARREQDGKLRAAINLLTVDELA